MGFGVGETVIHLVTFASDDMSISAQRCIESAERMGVDRVHRTAPVKPSSERGHGFWKWKPQVILAIMEGDGSPFLKPLNDGDILIYADAGVEFIEPVSIVIDRMDQDIWLFGNETLHRHWCKRDIIDAVWKITPKNGSDQGRTASWDRFDKQVQASVIFFRVNDYTRAFVKEWLDWCLYSVKTYTEVDGYKTIKSEHFLIDDSPSVAPNHPEFKENRHDQAILTTLAYREGIKLHHWYVRYHDRTPGRGPFYPNDDYPPLYLHHRRRNHEWEQAA